MILRVSLHRWKAPTSASQAEIFNIARPHPQYHYREQPLELILSDSTL